MATRPERWTLRRLLTFLVEQFLDIDLGRSCIRSSSKRGERRLPPHPQNAIVGWLGDSRRE
ncbi:MAG: hypothetical protein A2V77_17430 [Anaeromyxobacter sp. RBG_16_69_14]|nr:MAG: hypothetical protein A2V77_17430 [Anaeromyxobacter sp. RBG_16_69_14]